MPPWIIPTVVSEPDQQRWYLRNKPTDSFLWRGNPTLFREFNSTLYINKSADFFLCHLCTAKWEKLIHELSSQVFNDHIALVSCGPQTTFASVRGNAFCEFMIL